MTLTPNTPGRVSPLTFISLFAGVGGFDLGFERAGMECVAQVEIDEFAGKVLKKHWPDVPLLKDVSFSSGREYHACVGCRNVKEY